MPCHAATVEGCPPLLPASGHHGTPQTRTRCRPIPGPLAAQQISAPGKTRARHPRSPPCEFLSAFLGLSCLRCGDRVAERPKCLGSLSRRVANNRSGLQSTPFGTSLPAVGAVISRAVASSASGTVMMALIIHSLIPGLHMTIAPPQPGPVELG